MIFGLWRSYRRRQLMSQPFPESWLATITTHMRAYKRLTTEQQARIRALTQVFVPEKNWEGCNGLQMTDEIKVLVSAQMALLVLGVEDEYFDSVLSILVYPDAYVAEAHQQGPGGFVTVSQSAREGEAWHRGPVILNWDNVLEQARQPTGHNLVLHEFSHQLDMRNGREADGVPVIESREQAERWLKTTKAAAERLHHACAHRQRHVLDCYGCTNAAEFFAVSTESYFERPHALQQEEPELYDVMLDFYKVDPRNWNDD